MKKINTLTESIESRFGNLARKKNLKKQKIYSLGLGEPFFDTPRNISKSAFQSILSGNTKYSESKGRLKLRKKLSQKFNNRFGANTNQDNFMITPGSKFGLYLSLKSILQPKDNIVNFKPCYPSYDPQILLSEPTSNIITINLEKNFEIDKKKLKKVFQKKIKAIIVNSPNNPTGKIFSNIELKNVFNLAKKKRTWLIFDSIYDELNYLNIKINVPKEIISYERLIYLNSFSKSYGMTGWRLGYVYSNKAILNYMNKINQHLLTNVPLFIQDAGLEALNRNRRDILSFNKNLKLNFEYFKNKMAKFEFNLPDIVGGMFIFIDISRFNLKSDIFCEKLLKTYKVACTPGIFFGKKWDSHIRISLSISHKEFIRSVDKFSNFIDSIN